MKSSKLILRKLQIENYEEVIEVTNEAANLHGIIAIHNSKIGPACGGIRIYPYLSFDHALSDVLRLSKGMTNKSAIAQTKTGGAKSVIIVDNSSHKSNEMLLAFAEAINSFDGRYKGGEDLGTTLDDLKIMRQATQYVVGSIFNATF